MNRPLIVNLIYGVIIFLCFNLSIKWWIEMYEDGIRLEAYHANINWQVEKLRMEMNRHEH